MKIKKLICIIIKIIVFLIAAKILILILINSYFGYSLHGFRGLFKNNIFSLPAVIDEGEWVYEDDDTKIDIIIRDKELDQGRHMEYCGYQAPYMASDYVNYGVLINYFGWRSGRMVFYGVKTESDEVPFFSEDTGHGIFAAEFKVKLNHDLYCKILDSDPELWKGPNELTFKWHRKKI